MSKNHLDSRLDAVAHNIKGPFTQRCFELWDLCCLCAYRLIHLFLHANYCECVPNSQPCVVIETQNCGNKELTCDAEPMQSRAGAERTHAAAPFSVAIVIGCMMHILPSLLINQSINQGINQSINQPINQPTNQSTNQPTHVLFLGPSAEVMTTHDPSVRYTINKNHECHSSSQVLNMDNNQFLTEN